MVNEISSILPKFLLHYHFAFIDSKKKKERNSTHLPNETKLEASTVHADSIIITARKAFILETFSLRRRQSEGSSEIGHAFTTKTRLIKKRVQALSREIFTTEGYSRVFTILDIDLRLAALKSKAVLTVDEISVITQYME